MGFLLICGFRVSPHFAVRFGLFAEHWRHRVRHFGAGKAGRASADRIGERFFPFTAGARHGWPDRVRAPQRGLASIGPVFRRWCCGLDAILIKSRLAPPVAAAWQEPAFSLRPADQMTARCWDRHRVVHRAAANPTRSGKPD
jgi:hypothetical protein